MCGIIGYIGDKPCVPVILEGLKKLEYRGYDSAGIAVIQNGEFKVIRSEGKLTLLESKIGGNNLESTIGVGHTRWATHGAPTENNAHPHRAGSIVLVHNGIIENYLELKKELVGKGAVFSSETDTEVIAHLVDLEYRNGANGLYEATRRALARVKGAYAICLLSTEEPDRIVAAKNASPLVIGIGSGENFIASDIPALIAHTRRVMILEEGEIAEITREGIRITDLNGGEVKREEFIVNWTPAEAEKGGFKHFMLKEILEQPRAVVDTIRGRIKSESDSIYLEEAEWNREELVKFERVLILACGTSYHAGLVGKFIIEKLAKLPTHIDLGSEYRYRHPLPEKNTLCIAISQSGETADTVASMKQARENGAKILALCNIVGSTIARLADKVLYTRAGPEIGVASTKAFTTQLAALLMTGIYLGEANGRLDPAQASALIKALRELPLQIETLLEDEPLIREIAAEYCRYNNFLFLGRSFNYPIALEGALKLKEISYIHAEGYPAGEMKHGPIALIDKNMPVVIIATQNSAYEKTLSNLQEVRARGGRVIALATAADKTIPPMVDRVIEIPPALEEVEPILTVVPLQLLAYHIADYNGADVDQPRNLAKSVTVE
ncbi:MAG: glutamine--fructose-6-phosphate transaminase (isomerizing) [Myxococcota bacterium]